MSSEKFNGAFTLAEVLITLGIIGVVAALTMPTLISNHKRQVTVTKVKKFYSILSQDVNMSKVEYGDVSNWNWDLNLTAFVETYLLNNLNIIKNCKTTNGCWNSDGVIYGLNNSYKENIKGSTFYKIQLVDGTNLAFTKQDNQHVHVYCDINGNPAPNKYGHDSFVLTLTQGSFNDGFHKITQAGLWFFGHGLPRATLLNGNMHGCDKSKSGANCGALFQYDNWVVQPDYKF